MSYVPPSRREDGVFIPQQQQFPPPQQPMQQQMNYPQFQQQTFHPQQHGFRARGGYGGHGGHGGYQQQQRFGAPTPHVEPYTREECSPDDIFKDHSAGIDFTKYEEIKVSIQPHMQHNETFEEMGLEPALMENIRRCNYTKPTPVQKYGVPAVISGGDLMACAQTGSGKTAAYLIPAICYIMGHLNAGNSGRCATPTALILAPTRELSVQIYEESRKFTYRTGVRCVVAYGGADARHQLSEFSRGCHLCVATPGRLWDFFSRFYVRFNQIQFLVLDEADRMLDMGFEPQIRQIVQGPNSDMPNTSGRQTLLYSATFPKEIQQLAREFLNTQHYFLQVGRVGSTTENITQEVRFVDDNAKRDELVSILEAHTNSLVLVFVEKKRDADFLEHFLYQKQFAVTSIHGDRVQREREQALAWFKAGRVQVLVATDVASRGLDIPNVAAVVQYDLPSNIDSYVHRIGRTGRAGKQGIAIAMFNEKNKNIVDELVTCMSEAKQTVPEWLSGMITKRPQSGYGRGRGRGRGYRGGGYRGNSGGYNRGGFAGNNQSWRGPQQATFGGAQPSYGTPDFQGGAQGGGFNNGGY